VTLAQLLHKEQGNIKKTRQTNGSYLFALFLFGYKGTRSVFGIPALCVRQNARIGWKLTS